MKLWRFLLSGVDENEQGQSHKAAKCLGWNFAWLQIFPNSENQSLHSPIKILLLQPSSKRLSRRGRKIQLKTDSVPLLCQSNQVPNNSYTKHHGTDKGGAYYT